MADVKVGDRLEDLKTDDGDTDRGGVWTVKEIATAMGRTYAVIERAVPTERVIETNLIGPRYRRYRPVTEATDA